MSNTANSKYSSKVLKAISRYETDAKQRLLPEAEKNAQQFLPATDKNKSSSDSVHTNYETGLSRRPVTVAGDYVTAQPVSARKNIKILIILLLIATIAWGAQWRVDKQLNFPIIITDFGKEELIRSPVDGAVKEIFVSEDQAVTQGQQLLTIEPEAAKALVKLQQKHLELALRLAALQIQLEEEGFLQIPTHLLDRYPHVNAGLLLEHEQLLLKDRLAEQKEIDKPMKSVVAALSQEFQTKTIERQETDARLQELEQRLQKTVGLKKQNVVYDDGVYVDQLIETLKNMKVSLLQTVASLKQEETEIGSKLSEAELELRQIQLSNKQQLGQKLESVRTQINQVLSRIRDEEDKRQDLIVSSPIDGKYLGSLGLRIGDEIYKDKVIGKFRVPTDNGIAIGELSRQQASLVEIGMPVKVSLTEEQTGKKIDLNARVIAMAGGGGAQSADGVMTNQKIQIEFSSSPEFSVDLTNGTSAMAVADTKGIPLWRHICQSYGYEFCQENQVN